MEAQGLTIDEAPERESEIDDERGGLGRVSQCAGNVVDEAGLPAVGFIGVRGGTRPARTCSTIEYCVTFLSCPFGRRSTCERCLVPCVRKSPSPSFPRSLSDDPRTEGTVRVAPNDEPPANRPAGRCDSLRSRHIPASASRATARFAAPGFVPPRVSSGDRQLSRTGATLTTSDPGQRGPGSSIDPV